MRQIGAKTFHDEDQQHFAQLSHDFNPMHVDRVAARRLIAGHQVVHGIHLLLAAIEFWQQQAMQPLSRIACSFKSPVEVGEPVLFVEFVEPDNTSTINVTMHGLLCASISLGKLVGRPEVRPLLPGPDADTVLLELRTYALDQVPETHIGKHYALAVDGDPLASIFPYAYRCLGAQALASTVALSYMVGMVCPGLHSVFSSLSLDIPAQTGSGALLRFFVQKYDPRFRLFDIRVRGGIEGDIKAFLRAPPQAQASVLELADHVSPDEFKGSRSLVVGGSRGLGEVTAKLLAVGGGEVLITYAHGLQDALTIAHDINSQNPDRCAVQKLDMATDSFEALPVDWNTLDAIYYFATPKIFRKKAGVFEPAMFAEFCTLYVMRFYALCAFIENTRSSGKIRIYFPSTVAVSERPKGMAEYAMAKGAAEILVQEINRSFSRVQILSTQLPRLATDQTATILKVAAASNVATLLPLIRSMQV